MKDINKRAKILGSYNAEAAGVDLSKVPDTPTSYAKIEDLNRLNIHLIADVNKLSNDFPWLDMSRFLVLAGKLNDSGIWKQVFANISKDEMWEVDFGSSRTRDLDTFATAISEANSGLFMVSTQLCFLALLCGGDGLYQYVETHLLFTHLSKFINSASQLATTLELNSPATDPLILEDRIRNAFTVIDNGNGKPTTAIHETLEEYQVFGRCPFKNGTRLLYIQFHEWLETLPKGFFYYLMKSS